MPTPTRPIGLILFVLGVLGTPSTAQRSAPRAEALTSLSPEVAESLRLSGGSVQRLAVPRDGWLPFDVDVVFGGERHSLRLVPHDLRARGFRLEGSDGDIGTPLPTTYRGTVVGLPTAIVAAGLRNGALSAHVFLEDATWIVEPAPTGGRAHLVYRADQVALTDAFCGVDAVRSMARPRSAQADPQPASRRGLQVVQIALELTPAFRGQWGGVEGALHEAQTIINAVDVVFARDLDLALSISGVLVRDVGYGPNGVQALFNVANAWSVRPPPFERDVTHLFNGPPTAGSTLGIAFLSQACFEESHFSASWHTPTLAMRTTVTAHELGHSFGADHCDGAQPCNIMCARLGLCSMNGMEFAPTSIDAIRQLVATLECLDESR